MAANGDSNDFSPVTFAKDRERTIADLGARPLPVTAWIKNAKPLAFQALGINDAGLLLKIVDGDGQTGKAGDAVEVLFSVEDGQYHWTTKIVQAWVDRWLLDKGGELSRLQRRNNFRVSVPPSFKASFQLKSVNAQSPAAAVAALAVVDMSAGGARVVWPKTLALAAVGDMLTGTLMLPDALQIDVSGSIKNLRTDVVTGAVHAGVEFQKLSGRDEQALLHLCLQIRRQFVSK